MFKNLSTNTAWGFLLFGGLIECFWVSGLKYAQTPLEYTATGIILLISFGCGMVAFKKIEVSIAYSVYVGIGAAGVVLLELLVFDEPFSFVKITLIVTLMCGVMGLKFASKEIDKTAQNFSTETMEELGLNTALSEEKDSNVEDKGGIK